MRSSTIWHNKFSKTGPYKRCVEPLARPVMFHVKLTASLGRSANGNEGGRG